MKVMHINTLDMVGGAAKASYRIHLEMSKEEESIFLTKRNTVKHQNVVGLTGKNNKIKDILNTQIDAQKNKLFKIAKGYPWNYNNNIFEIIPFDRINKMDIVNLHWINSNFLSIKSLLNIKRPLIWTLHDSWAFTGGCHIPYECGKYVDGCTHCVHIGRNDFFDISKKMFQEKKYIYNKIKMNVVCPSNWLANAARNSILLGNKNICVIPNGLDLKLYKPLNKEFARHALNMKMGKKYILFGAVSATSDENKGFEYISTALKSLYARIENKDEIEIIIFGSDKIGVNYEFGFRTTSLGTVYDDYTLCMLYSASDVMIVPSKSENLPNTVMESMACGTPVVAFSVGGILDLVDHKYNGYLAEPYNVNDIVYGIEYILLNQVNLYQLSQNARNKIMKSFDINITVKKYLELYNEILAGCTNEFKN